MAAEYRAFQGYMAYSIAPLTLRRHRWPMHRQCGVGVHQKRKTLNQNGEVGQHNGYDNTTNETATTHDGGDDENDG